jgi:hypothetical protein
MLAVGFIPRRRPHHEPRRVATIEPEPPHAWESPSSLVRRRIAQPPNPPQKTRRVWQWQCFALGRWRRRHGGLEKPRSTRDRRGGILPPLIGTPCAGGLESHAPHWASRASFAAHWLADEPSALPGGILPPLIGTSCAGGLESHAPHWASRPSFAAHWLADEPSALPGGPFVRRSVRLA